MVLLGSAALARVSDDGRGLLLAVPTQMHSEDVGFIECSITDATMCTRERGSDAKLDANSNR